MAKKIKRSMIHKELRNLGSFVRFFAGRPSMKKFIRIHKRQVKWFKGRNITKKDLDLEQIYVDDCRVAIFRPKDLKPNAVGLLWLHGGGHVNGIPEMESDYFKKFLLNTNTILFAPDYSKSHQEPFPKALEQSYSVLKYMKDHASSYGINTDQLFVAGVSAGGGLAAALTLYARDKKEIEIAFQMPLYPMLDDRFTESNKDNDAPMWNTKSNIIAWKRYLGDKYQTDDVSYYAAPARARDFTNLPPTLTFIGGIDLFKDETVAYVNNLKAAGVETKFKIYEGCFHAFEVLSFWKSVSKDAIEFSLNGYIYATENYFKKQKQ